VRYIAVAATISAGATLAARELSPLYVGLALFLVLSLLGIGILRRRQRSSKRQRIETLRRELNQTRRSYRQLFSSVPCFICVLDRDHRVVEANDLYRAAFNGDDLSLCYQVCKHRTTQCPDCIVDRTFDDGEVRSNEETLHTRDGRRISAVVYTQPVFDDDGIITNVMEVFTDITEVKRLQRQLALTGRAVASMAHRVKNILMGLEGGIFVVNTGFESDDRDSIHEGWDMVQRNVGLVSRIVKDLLYCSKDRDPEFHAGVDPREIVRDVQRLYVDRVAGEKIELRIEVGDQDVTGTFDPDGIHSLLCNLVANAIDACRFDPSADKPQHTITLRARLNRQGMTVLEVEDDGAGIPEDLNAKVFEDFFSSKGTEGTGIGLLVVQKVTEEHGGRVSFTSTPGGLTTFTVTIPTERQPAATADHPQSAAMP
jgi:signal transduction histidine kinase